jgi:hypothetical protein
MPLHSRQQVTDVLTDTLPTDSSRNQKSRDGPDLMSVSSGKCDHPRLSTCEKNHVRNLELPSCLCTNRWHVSSEHRRRMSRIQRILLRRQEEEFLSSKIIEEVSEEELIEEEFFFVK